MKKSTIGAVVCSATLFLNTQSFATSTGSGASDGGSGAAEISIEDPGPRKQLTLRDLRTLYQFGTVTAEALCRSMYVFELDQEHNPGPLQMVRALLTEQKVDCSKFTRRTAK